jgi:adenylate kinase family enzyme
MGYRKIHIIGSAGSGKTYTSIKLSEIIKAEPKELDELFWDKSDPGYNKTTNPKDRNRQLNKLVKKESWILEGVYFDWVEQSLREADLIIFLESNFILCTIRMIQRYIKRGIGLSYYEKKETILGFLQTIKRNWRYHQQTPEIIRSLSIYEEKLIVLKNGNDAIQHILSNRKKHNS